MLSLFGCQVGALLRPLAQGTLGARHNKLRRQEGTMGMPGFTAGASLYRTSRQYSSSAVPAQAGEVILQQALVSRLPASISVPCVGPNCPSPLPQVGQVDGFPAVPGTNCAQLCIQKYTQALGNCSYNCKLAYPSAGQYTQYQNCLTGCETAYGYS